MQRLTINLLTMRRAESGLFDNLALPANVVKEDLVDRLLLELGELEVTYTNPLVMQDAIGFWSRTRKPIWEKIYNIMTYEYNPGWNVDGETWHEGESESHSEGATSNTGSSTESGTKTNVRDRDQTDTFTGSKTDSGDTTNFISADNSAGWSNDTRQEYDSSETTNNSDIIREDITDTETSNRTGSTTGAGTSEEDRTGAESWHEKRQGNIGVTTTQKLLTEEKELWENFDFYGYIIEDFKQEFCVMLW